MSGRPTSPQVYALAFETSGRDGSIALGLGGRILDVRHFSGPRKHAVEFLPSIAGLCRAHRVAPCDIAHVFVSQGPGSFTGLRIGTTAARMLALANRAELVGVPTLNVIAENAVDVPEPPERAAVLLDAKRGRVYAAAFVRIDGTYQPETEPIEADPRIFLAERHPDCAVLGEGVLYHREAVAAAGRPVLPEALYPPRAETVYRLGHRLAVAGKFTPPRTLVPTYVRPPEAEEKWEEKIRSGGR